MRFVIYGAGGVGGTIGGRLSLAGHQVTLICRGAHLDAIRERGLLLRTPEFERTIAIDAVGHPSEINWSGDEIVFLTMKTQDTAGALDALEAIAGTSVPVFCAQNGVENERLVARRFDNVYATLVALPATFLSPGEVIASAIPLSGCLHSGRFPGAIDGTVTKVCEALSGSGFRAAPSADVMALKHRKLILNLSNGVEVIAGRSGWAADGELGDFVAAVRGEAIAVYAAAGIVSVSPEEYAERVTAYYRAALVGGEARSAGSTLQGVLRGNRTTEVDFLNGEIELLGKVHSVATPFNSTVRRVASSMASRGDPPGSVSARDLWEAVRSLESRGGN